jgi:hypothetical protein
MTKSKATPKTLNPAIDTVIQCPTALSDIQLQRGLFLELPQGRYTIEYRAKGGAVQPVSVYWDGEQLH